MIRLLRVKRSVCMVGALATLATTSAFAESIDAPGAQKILSTTASGVQIYTCEYGADHTLGWTFQQPRAKLYDAHGAAVIEHAAGPSWAAPDGSRIEGKVVAQQPSATPGSVPQLLLQTHSTGAPGLLAPVRYVQRINTVGGAKPPAPCTSEHESGSSPYLATYVFYQ